MKTLSSHCCLRLLCTYYDLLHSFTFFFFDEDNNTETQILESENPKSKQQNTTKNRTKNTSNNLKYFMQCILRKQSPLSKSLGNWLQQAKWIHNFLPVFSFVLFLLNISISYNRRILWLPYHHGTKSVYFFISINQSSSSSLALFILPHTQAPKFICRIKNFNYLRQQAIPWRKHQTK